MTKLLRVLPVKLALLLALALAVSVSAQAGFEVTDLNISSKSVTVGENVTITATITNATDTSETYSVELKLNGEVKYSQELTLDTRQSDNVTFIITANMPGDYVVELGDASDYFTVEGTSFWSIFPTWLWGIIGAIVGVLILLIIVLLAVPSRKKQAGAGMKGQPIQSAMPMPIPMSASGTFSPTVGGQTTMPPQAPGVFPNPEQFQTVGTFPTPTQFPAPGPMTAPYQQYARRPIFSVSNLTITPNQVKSGNPVTISAIVSNNGSEAGTYSVVLRINGMVENIIDLMLSPGTSQPTTFTVTKENGGDYYAEVDGLGGIFIVIPLVPANFTVGNLVIAPERAKQGECIIISAVVTNNGELPGSYSAVLKLKGAVEATEEIDLSPGENRKVAFKIAKTTPGFYNVELEGLTGRFVVEMEWQK